MTIPTLEEKCTQLQLMSAPAFLAACGAAHMKTMLATGELATLTNVLREGVSRRWFGR